jgi:hypothetical protein
MQMPKEKAEPVYQLKTSRCDSHQEVKKNK